MNWSWFDEAVSQLKAGESSAYIDEALEEDGKRRALLEKARQNFYSVKVPANVARNCVRLAAGFQAEGNRGDYIIALAARAYAALQGKKQVTNNHVTEVARLALQHHRPEVLQSNQMPWSNEDDERVTEILSGD